MSVEVLAILPEAECLRHPRGPRIVGLNDNMSTLKGALAVTRHGPAGEVAAVRINGALAYQLSWYGSAVWMGDLIATFSELAADVNIKAVLLDINSPGGDTMGMSGVLESLRALASSKPVYAMANDVAASAAYWLATAARELVITQTAMIGSIGVMAVLKDTSGMLAQMGIRHEVISTGKNKIGPGHGVPIDDAMRTEARRIVEAHSALLLADVAAFTKLEPSAIAALEGSIMIGQDGINAGLASRVTTASAYLAEIVSRTVKESQMSTPTPNTPTAPNTTNTPNTPNAPATAPNASATATLAQLQQVYGDDNTSIVAALGAGFTLDQARDDVIAKLRAKAAAPATPAPVAPNTPTAPSARIPGVPTGGADPLANTPRLSPDQEMDFVATVKACATAEQITFQKALVKMAAKHPEAHKAYVANQPRIAAHKVL